MDTSATRSIGAGVRVSVELSGSIASYVPDSIFVESFQQQLLLQGLDFETVSIASEYGIVSRPYKITTVVRSNVPTNVSTLVATVRTAAENAGSYTPAVTIPAIGEASQAAPAPSAASRILDGGVQLLSDVAQATGTAAKNVADAPKDLFSGINLIVIGIVVLVAVVAFGPNLRGIGRNVSIG